MTEKTKYGEIRRAPTMMIGRDRRWVVPFLKAVAEKHPDQSVSDLVRRALCKRLMNGEADAPKRASSRPEKQEWDRVQVYLDDAQSVALRNEVERQGRPATDILLIVFCEAYGEEFPELREVYEKWRDVNLVEAA